MSKLSQWNNNIWDLYLVSNSERSMLMFKAMVLGALVN